jgi:hypothetical protein
MTSEERESDYLAIVRRFLTDITDLQNGARLVAREKEIGLFLENEMDQLSPQERYRVYGFMEGIFPSCFKGILRNRLQKEDDAKCLQVLRIIAALHPEDEI